MAHGKARLARQAIKYGPVVFALAQRYGPQMVDQVVKQRQPAQRLVTERAAKGRTNPRKRALAHADTVVEGSLQQVFHRGQPHWVVFSRDEPVGVHPHTDVPFDVLLLNSDPAKRQAPDDLRRTVHLPRRSRR